MEKKIYNQMGFDFGDGDPEQESPAAGFRIKSMKPASKADAGEQEQDKDNQDELSGVNGQATPAQPTAATGNSGSVTAGMIFEPDPEKQKSEDDPNNDSEVIPNIPATSEAEAHSGGHVEGTSEQDLQAEMPAEQSSAASGAPAPEAEEAKAVQEILEEEKKKAEEEPKPVVQQATVPNIPARLTRPTQVYAVEEKESQPEAKKENPGTDIGFKPASSKLTVNEPANTQEEKPAQAAQPVQENTSGPVENISAQPVIADPQASVDEPKPVVAQEPVPSAPEIPDTGTTQSQGVIAKPKAETPPSTVSEPVQQYQSAPRQQNIPEEEPQDIYEDEDFNPIENTLNASSFAEPEPPKKSTRGRKSLKTLDAEAGSVAIPDDSTLFKRQYYSIGEVAGMFAVNQSLLRFWENEFDIIQPRKNRKGDRHFRPVDIKNLELIYDLLRRRKLTIEGAKEFLKKNKQARERFEMIQSLQQIKGFLLEIKASL